MTRPPISIILYKTFQKITYKIYISVSRGGHEQNLYIYANIICDIPEKNDMSSISGAWLWPTLVAQ
jgi:hypothetical protein